MITCNYLDSMKKFYKMKVLLTGGRAPYTLELLRIFGREGHEVHILEFVSPSLCSYSKYCHKVHLICAPNPHFEVFKSELTNILMHESFDIVIPTCEEAVYLSEIKSEIDQHSFLFTPDFDLIYKLHNKDLFIQYLEQRGLNTPKNYFHLSEISPQNTYIVKKKLSRFGGHVQKLQGININEPFDFSTHIIQEYISGQEYCVYVVFHRGKVTAQSVYLKQLTIDGGATNLFESIDEPLISNWIKSFFSEVEGSGQFSFDVFIANNKVYPIECNPRTTSGVHLLRDSLSLDHFCGKNKVTANPNHKSMYMLAVPLILFSLSPKIIIPVLKKFFKAKDVIWDLKDFKPALGQFCAFFKFCLIALKNRVGVIEATTLDIEYDKIK